MNDRTKGPEQPKPRNKANMDQPQEEFIDSGGSDPRDEQMITDADKTPEFQFGNRLDAEMAKVRTLEPQLLPDEVRRQAEANLKAADAELEKQPHSQS